MKKEYIIIIVLFFNLFIMFSCKPVVSTDPLGYEPFTVEPNSWEGVWIDSENQLFYINVINRKEGILNVKFVDNNANKDETIKKQFKAILKKGDKYNYLNILYEELINKEEIKEKYKKTYLWGIFKKSKDMIVFYYPDEYLFENSIKNGKLNGKINNELIILNESYLIITNFIERKKFKLIFDANSYILKRIVE